MTTFTKFLTFLTILAGLSIWARFTGLDPHTTNTGIMLLALMGYFVYPKELKS